MLFRSMGLETIEPIAFERLNKAMTLEHFQAAVEFLRGEGIHVRAFVLLQPFGTTTDDSVQWAIETVNRATAWGVERTCVIPTRPGNGFLDLMLAEGKWCPPDACQLESYLERVLRDRESRSLDSNLQPVYTVDLWNWGELEGTCQNCSRTRRSRLERMNLQQRLIDRDATMGDNVPCDCL